MRKQRSVAWVLLLFFLLVPLSCGIKTPPFVPAKVLPPRVAGLKAMARGGQVLLTGGLVSGSEGKTASAASKSRVYSLRYEPDNVPCEGCPLPFEKFVEVEPESVGKGLFQCSFPLWKKKGIYYIMIRLVDRDGNAGPPSDTVKLKIP